MFCFYSATFLVPRSGDGRIYRKQQEAVQKPRPCRSVQEEKRRRGGRFSPPDWCSHLSVSADSGRGGGAQTAVGGRSRENCKVISLRFSSSPAGMELGMLSAFATMNG